MDESKPPSSPDDLDAPIGLDPDPIAVDVRHLVDLTRPHSNMVVYCGNEELVGQGFVIALRAMGIEADFPDRETLLRCPNEKEH